MSSVEAVRALFPALSGDTVRLDGPGGSQTPQSVLDAIVTYLSSSNSNVGGVYAQSQATADLVVRAGERAAQFLGASSRDEVGFGLNATSLNFTLSRIAARQLRPGDEIVVTALEHDSNITPWRQAAEERGLIIRTVGITPDSRLDMAALAAAIGPRTRIVAFGYANNAIGTAIDVPEVVRLAHAAGALAWADVTHWAPHAPANVDSLGIDVAICSAYKFFGPHVGVAYVRSSVGAQWEPGYFKRGTLPFESLAGLIAAFDHVERLGWEAIAAHEHALGQRFLAGLPDGWELLGLPTMDGRTATFALTSPRHPVEVAKELAAQGIAVGAGRFNSSTLFDTLGLPDGALRIGFLHYNSSSEVDRVLAALRP